MKFTVCAIDRELDGKRPFPLVAPSYAKCAEIAKELGFDGIELQIQDPTGYNGSELKRHIIVRHSAMCTQRSGCFAFCESNQVLFDP